ncbi:hypothetical protein Tcan_00756, partial [Toxocara canis]
MATLAVIFCALYLTTFAVGGLLDHHRNQRAQSSAAALLVPYPRVGKRFASTAIMTRNSPQIKPKLRNPEILPSRAAVLVTLRISSTRAGKEFCKNNVKPLCSYSFQIEDTIKYF